MQAVMLGQSFAGILSSLLSIFCQAFTSNSLLNGRLYFAIATVWTFASGVLYIWLIKSPHTIAVMNSEVNETSRMEQNRNLLLDTDDVIGLIFELLICFFSIALYRYRCWCLIVFITLCWTHYCYLQCCNIVYSCYKHVIRTYWSVSDGLQSEVSDNSLRSRIFEDDSLKKHIGRILSQVNFVVDV